MEHSRTCEECCINMYTFYSPIPPDSFVLATQHHCNLQIHLNYCTTCIEIQDLSILDEAWHVAHVCLSTRWRNEGQLCSTAKLQRKNIVQYLRHCKRQQDWASLASYEGCTFKKPTYPSCWNHFEAFFRTNLCSSSSLRCFMSKAALLLWSCKVRWNLSWICFHTWHDGLWRSKIKWYIRFMRFTSSCDKSLLPETVVSPYFHLFLQICELLMQFVERRGSLRLVAMLLHISFPLVEQVG